MRPIINENISVVDGDTYNIDIKASLFFGFIRIQDNGGHVPTAWYFTYYNNVTKFIGEDVAVTLSRINNGNVIITFNKKGTFKIAYL